MNLSREPQKKLKPDLKPKYKFYHCNSMTIDSFEIIPLNTVRLPLNDMGWGITQTNIDKNACK